MHGVRHDPQYMLDATSDLRFEAPDGDLRGSQKRHLGSALASMISLVGRQRIGNVLPPIGTIGIVRPLSVSSIK